MKKIMILGAGRYQVPLILKAKEMGLYTIVVSIDGNYPGFKHGDKVYYIDTTNQEEVLKLAIKEQIDGICTAGTDVAVSTIGYVCDRLGLCGLSMNSSQVVTDKALMKKCFVENDVNTAKFHIVRSVEDGYIAYNDLISKHNKKVVMKIVDKSGSRGIVCIDDANQIEKIFDEQMKMTNKKYIVMEQYISGHEIGVDAFIKDGKVLLVLPHEKLIYKIGDIGIPIGHILPYSIDENIYLSLYKEVNKAIKATGLNNCAVNMDIFICEDNTVSIIEIGGRSGATGIPEIISEHIGQDYYEMIIKNALDMSIECTNMYNENNGYVASCLLYSELDGRLDNIIIHDKYKGYVQYDYEIGAHVNKMVDGTDRLGQVILSKNSHQEILDDIDEFYKSVKIVVK